MSSTTVKKANGENITFNFKLENGLPVKPIILPAYQEGYSNSSKRYVLSIFLEKVDLEKLKVFKIEKQYTLQTKKENEIWLLINEHYIAMNKISDIIIEALNKGNLDVCFYDIDKKFIIGFNSESNKN